MGARKRAKTRGPGARGSMGVVVRGPVDSRLAEVAGEDGRKRSLSVRCLARRRQW